MFQNFLSGFKNANKIMLLFGAVIVLSLVVIFMIGNPFKNGHNVAAVGEAGQTVDVPMLNLQDHDGCRAVGGEVVQRRFSDSSYCRLNGPITSIPNPISGECDRVFGFLTTSGTRHTCNVFGKFSAQIMSGTGDCAASGGFAYVAKDRKGTVEGNACVFPSQFFVIPIQLNQLSSCTDMNGFYGQLRGWRYIETYCALGEPYSNVDANMARFGNCEGLPGGFTKDRLVQQARGQGCFILPPTVLDPVDNADCMQAVGVPVPETTECYMVGNFAYKQGVERDRCFAHKGVPVKVSLDFPAESQFCFVPEIVASQ